jgi:hypothetical protein
MKCNNKMLLILGIMVGFAAEMVCSDLPAKKPVQQTTLSQKVINHVKEITKSASKVALDYKQVAKLGDALKIIQAADKEGQMTDKKQLEAARILLLEALPLVQHSLEAITELVALTNMIDKELLTKIALFGKLTDPKSPAAIINKISLQLQYALLVFSGVFKAIAEVDPKKLFEEQKKEKEEAQKETTDLEKKINEIIKSSSEEMAEPPAPDYEAPEPPAPSYPAPEPPAAH